MTMRTSVLLALLAGFVSIASAGVPESVPEGQIPGYKLLGPGLAVAGQPSPESLAQLKAMGFKTVVNLRTEQEGALGEQAVVERQGLRYVHVPVTPETFTLSDVEAVQKVLDDPASGPVLFHCASSNRVGAVYAVIQSRKGRTPEQALADGTTAGLRSPVMVAAVRKMLGLPADLVPAPAVKP